MKHQKIFNTFISTIVNLNQTRIDRLTNSSESVVGFIKNSMDFKGIFIEDSAQGSYGHRTIIKPLPGKEFDADIVIFMKEQVGWEAKDYVNKIKSTLELNKVYKDKISRGNRCVCVNYAGDFHIDIVPCVVKPLNIGLNIEQYFVCNRSTNEFEQTDPNAYKMWVKGKNTSTKNNQLIKSIRLFKYLRDIKTTFSCKSILMTTLISNQIHDHEDSSNHFCDIATSLRTIISRLDDYLSLHQKMPIISNPVQAGENFNRHWDQAKYQNFKNFISKYRVWIEDAYDESDREESIRKWRKVFGEKFNSTTGKVNKAKSYAEVLQESEQDYYPIPPHCIPHGWNEAEKVRDISLTIHHRPISSSQMFFNFVSNVTLPKRHTLEFRINEHIDDDNEIYWQVTNTGTEARLNNQLRGGFELGSIVKEETTSYKGNHFVEAFIVKNNTLIGRTGKRVIPIS